jgi:hypothetical protein
MNSVERLRRLPAFATHRRLAAIRIVESFCRPEVLHAVFQIRCLILLLVAHDAFPFPSPSKNISRVARATPAHTDRATRSALLPACSLSELHAGKRFTRLVASQRNRLKGFAPGKKLPNEKLDT